MSEATSKPSSDNSSSGGCCGCITFPIFCLILWALIFGVTVGGKHYGVSGCSRAGGVEFTP